MGYKREHIGRRVIPVSIVIILISISSALSQHRIISENFSDENLQSGTKWSGDLSHFTYFKDSTGNVWLRLNDESKSGESDLVTRSDVAYGSWTFTVKLDFKPSASNRLLVQLISDQPNLTSGGNGYALTVGENGDHDVWHLVRYENGNPGSVILSGTGNMADGGISKIRITRSKNGKWVLSEATGENGTLKPEVTGMDNAIKTSRYFGFIFSYTSTRADKFYLDDISVDAFSAFPVNANVTSDKDLLVTYSLPVSSGSAQLQNVSLDHSINPESIEIDNQGRLLIHFPAAVNPGSHLLRIRGLTDRYGFSIPDTTVQVYWPYHAKNGDLVISEFMYDPPSGLPEYVELYNTTEFAIGINGWTLGDSSHRYKIYDSESLPSHSYLVLTPDSTLLYNTFGMGNYLMLSSWPVLNNGGDEIVIRDQSGNVIDSLSYDTRWRGNGVSLERKSFNVPAYYIWNWSESHNLDGGTPGKANTATADSKGPGIKSLEIPDNRHITFHWSEEARDTSVINPEHYLFSKNIKATNVIRLADSTFQITLNPGLIKNTKYRLSVTGVVDWFGNTMAPFDTTVSYYHIVNPDSGQVFITEFMYDPPESQPEYIELYNRGPDAVNMENWRLSDSNNYKAVISDAAKILPPDQYVVLTSDAIPDWSNIQSISMHSRFPSLNNGSDQIKIYRSDGVLMDSLKYSSAFGGKRVSLERRSVDVPAWVTSNWGDSPALAGGTPGLPNKIGPDAKPPKITGLSYDNQGDRITIKTDEEILTSAENHPKFVLNPSVNIKTYHWKSQEISILLAENMVAGKKYELKVINLSDYFGNKRDTTITFLFQPDQKPPDLLFTAYNSTMDSVRLAFDEKIAGLSGVSISVNGQPIESGSISFIDSTNLTIPVTWKPKSEATGDDQILVKGFSDRWGNTLGSRKMPIARPWHQEKLLVNEIMYHPITNAHDNEPDQSEYVELYNDSNISLDLDGFYIHNEPDENGRFKTMQPVASNLWVLPHGYVVFYADTAASFHNSRLYRFFKPDSAKAHFYRINGLSLQLSSDHDAVYLSNDTTAVDSVVYSDTWQNPTLMDTQGRSLERITIDGPSNSRNNWTSCAAVLGGTPGAKNSVYEQSPEVKKQNNLLEIAPNPFSPDGDGFHDNLVLTYHFSTTGYRLRVRIFDRFGRLIRTLANGKLAGSSGTLIWNGLDDNGRKNRIGIYIILFEAYGSNNGPDRELKKTVVLARHL